jgi:hypothetical protein
MFDYPDHPITNVFKKILGYQRLAVPYIKYVRQLKISHTKEKLCQLNDTVADVLSRNLEEIVSLWSTILDYQNHFEQHVIKTAQALITYDATAHDLGQKQEKLIKAIKDHDSEIGEMKQFMFRLEENQQRRHKERVQFILAKGVNNDNAKMTELSSVHKEIEAHLFFSDNSIRLPEPTIQGNIEGGMPTRHNVPSVFAALLEPEGNDTTNNFPMMVASPPLRRIFTRDNEIVQQAKLNFQMTTDVLVNNESPPELDYDHFPLSWQSLCTEWEGKQLATFAHVGKKTSRWGRKIASGWFKHKSAFNQIERMMKEYKLKTAYSAAKFLDDHRLGVDKIPMGKHVEKL